MKKQLAYMWVRPLPFSMPTNLKKVGLCEYTFTKPNTEGWIKVQDVPKRKQK